MMTLRILRAHGIPHASHRIDNSRVVDPAPARLPALAPPKAPVYGRGGARRRVCAMTRPVPLPLPKKSRRIVKKSQPLNQSLASPAAHVRRSAFEATFSVADVRRLGARRSGHQLSEPVCPLPLESRQSEGVAIDPHRSKLWQCCGAKLGWLDVRASV